MVPGQARDGSGDDQGGIVECCANDDLERTLARASHGLWVIVHGIAGLATSSKLNVLEIKSAKELLDDLVNTYIEGLVAEQS